MHIPMTDLEAQYVTIKEEIDSAIERVVTSGKYILGSEVEKFENEIAAYCGTRHAVGVASGSDALILSLLAYGIGAGDEVITTPFTFIATAMAITHCGALPVFVDIDPVTYNIDPEQIEQKITTKTKAIIVVHLFGQPADLQPIMDLGEKYNLCIIEDCAQSLSAMYKNRKTGSIGDAGCFSFFPSKNLGGLGDGGMIVTGDSDIADTVRMLRQHGSKSSYCHLLPGYNSRLDALQAAILSTKLKHLDQWSLIRRQKSALYSKLIDGISVIKTPDIAGDRVCSANYYTVRLSEYIDRSKLRNYLDSRGIDTSIYYPLSLHLQEVYKQLGYRKGDYPESEKAQEQVLSLPMYPELADSDIVRIVEAIKEFCRSKVQV